MPRRVNVDDFLSLQRSSLVSVERVSLRRWTFQSWTIRALNFFGKWAFSLCRDFPGEIDKPLTNTDLAFVAVPFFFMLQWHLQQCFCDPLHMLRSKKQTCKFLTHKTALDDLCGLGLVGAT